MKRASECPPHTSILNFRIPAETLDLEGPEGVAFLDLTTTVTTSSNLLIPRGVRWGAAGQVLTNGTGTLACIYLFVLCAAEGVS